MTTFAEKHGPSAIDELEAAVASGELETVIVPIDGDWDNMESAENMATAHASCFVAHLRGRPCGCGGEGDVTPRKLYSLWLPRWARTPARPSRRRWRR